VRPKTKLKVQRSKKAKSGQNGTKKKGLNEERFTTDQIGRESWRSTHQFGKTVIVGGKRIVVRAEELEENPEEIKGRISRGSRSIIPDSNWAKVQARIHPVRA